MVTVQALRGLCLVLYAVSLGLGGTILVYARHTMRPRRSGPGLMYWHILSITLALWGWELVALVPILGLYEEQAPLIWRGPTFIAFALLTNFALYLILKVQRGRLALTHVPGRRR